MYMGMTAHNPYRQENRRLLVSFVLPFLTKLTSKRKFLEEELTKRDADRKVVAREEKNVRCLTYTQAAFHDSGFLDAYC